MIERHKDRNTCGLEIVPNRQTDDQKKHFERINKERAKRPKTQAVIYETEYDAQEVIAPFGRQESRHLMPKPHERSFESSLDGIEVSHVTLKKSKNPNKHSLKIID